MPQLIYKKDEITTGGSRLSHFYHYFQLRRQSIWDWQPASILRVVPQPHKDYSSAKWCVASWCRAFFWRAVRHQQTTVLFKHGLSYVIWWKKTRDWNCGKSVSTQVTILSREGQRHSNVRGMARCDAAVNSCMIFFKTGASETQIKDPSLSEGSGEMKKRGNWNEKERQGEAGSSEKCHVSRKRKLKWPKEVFTD